MLIQRLHGKATEWAGNVYITAIQLFSRMRWIRTPEYDTDVLGEGQYRYRLDRQWCQTDAQSLQVNNCHEMVIDSKNRLYLLTDNPKNNIIIFNRTGHVEGKWTLNSSGAHGLTLAVENGKEVLWICDPYNPRVMKFSLSGDLLKILPNPADAGIYSRSMPYAPTQTAVAPNGDIYVADGYGSQHILQFDNGGNLVRVFGGKGKERDKLDFAHGIAVDTRDPEHPILLVTSRKASCLKRFSLDGEYLNDIPLPGGFPCRPVVHGQNILLGLCWSGKHLKANSGFVALLDKNNRVCATLGGTAKFDESGNLTDLVSDFSSFCHVHDVCADGDDNLYVCQWNAGKVYPYLLKRMK
ncbi:6-bladed beta-propeller [Litorivivens sp.]|uniref:6-bladed beta-propeller n=1 Tax=Litorivivens sp. TaxID=2020868 RepID=UPI003568DA70